ncbi:MAG TPA: glycosyltransferase family A protein [Verrucomicrobiae bacterium]
MPKLASTNEVSVVIPAFNAERYLAAAVESVLAQTFLPLEILVVDDGSTDATPKSAEPFGGKIIYLRRPHSGISATRNCGIKAARGNWLAFLDADDLWTREKLESQLAVAEKNRALEIIFGGIQQFVSPELNRAGQMKLSAPLETSMAPHVGTMLVRTTVFERVGLFDETLNVAEFIEWFARAQDAGVSLTTLPEIVLKRRRHLTNTTLRQKNSLTDMTFAMKRILDRRRQTALAAQL